MFDPKVLEHFDLSSDSTLFEVQLKLVESLHQTIDTEFELALRTNAVPVLKGKITSRKVKWRGIYLKNYNVFFGCHSYWLEQRGKRISKIIAVDFINKSLEVLNEAGEIAMEIVQKPENENMDELNKKIFIEACKLANEEQLKYYKDRNK